MTGDRMKSWWCRAAAIAVLAAVACIPYAAQVASQSGPRPRYAPNGDLLVPAGFESWVFVGSNLGLAYRQELAVTTAAEAARADRQIFHNVYINPEAYAYFVATRQFPEPTILVMEQFTAADKEPKGILSSGVFNGDRVGLEVAVKNSARPDGQRTPWAYYNFTDPNDPSKVVPAAPAFPDRACENCHRQHASLDNVWVQFYPALRKLLQ
jgi:hypothetical protein